MAKIFATYGVGGTSGATYPSVDTYADLPSAGSVPVGTIYVVLETTGIWPFQDSNGFYVSDGISTWTYLGKVALNGSSIYINPAGMTYVSSTNAQGAIGELDAAIAASGGVTSFNARTGAVVPVSGDYPASLVPYTPTNGIVSSTTQNAVSEVKNWALVYSMVLG